MPVPGKVKIKGILFVLMLALVCSGIRASAAQTVKLPITIDYGLLQTLILRNAYTEAKQSVTLLNKGNGCLFLALSKPVVSEANGLIRFETRVVAHAGTPLGDSCVVPVSWQGYLVLYQRPVIDGRTWKLSFKTTSSTLLDMNRRPAKIAEVVWTLIKSQVFSYLESIAIDLAPPVNDLKTFLLPLFPQGMQQQTQAMLQSLRVGEARVTPKAIIVDLLADVREVYKAGEAPSTEALSGKALDDMVGVWEQWDAMLSFMVSLMSRDVLKEEERQTLMDVLLETRYAFVEGLGSRNLPHDFVREQFVRAWRRLSPIFRNHLGQNTDDQTLGYLSFFTAADALSVLDGLGPTFGIEMSRDGLIRMARMLTSDQSILSYSSGVNLDLRKVFQLMPTLQVEKIEPPEDTADRPVDQGQQAPPDDRSKVGIPGVQPEPSIRKTLPDQGVKTIPAKPVEQDIKPGDLTQPRNEVKPQGGGKDGESQLTGPNKEGELGRLIDQIKQGARDEGGKSGTPVVPPELSIEKTPPDQGVKTIPAKPVEQDIKPGDLTQPRNEVKPQGGGKDGESQLTGPNKEGELGRLIDQIKQGARDEGGKSGTPVVPQGEPIPKTPADQGVQAVPDKPVERDIDVDKAFKQQEQNAPQENATSPAGKGNQGGLIDSGKIAPSPDQTKEDSRPELKYQDEKPVEPDSDTIDPFNIQDKPLDKGGKEQSVDPKDKQTSAVHPPLGAMIWDFLFPPAYAGDLAKYDILRWKVPESGVDQYVKKVEEVLNKTSQAVLGRGEFPASLHGMFHSMILAMAWQESCFRQFIEKDHKLTYVLSYNNTSVGLMQVNERVWRGIYDRERLRWDIEYNAAAGNEIAALYLQKYALRDRKVAQKLEPATIARLVYAMYNGGPGQYHDFLERLRKGKMLSSDDVFLEKYSLVTSGNGEKLSQCLTGN